jgi:tRNA(Ile)-lysidine synthase TilS/MesJ
MLDKQMKSMPARYYSSDSDVHVIQPLISCLEDDIATFAKEINFPILPCNSCGTQPDAQRAKVKSLVDMTLSTLNPNAKRNMINAMSDVRPCHLLDVELREVLTDRSLRSLARLSDGGGIVLYSFRDSGAGGGGFFTLLRSKLR